MNPCSPSGTRPAKMPTTHAASTANQTAIPQIASQIKWGITSRIRKKTVERLRRRSSVTTRRTECAPGVSVDMTGSCSDIGAPCARGRDRSGAGEARRSLLQERPDSFGEVAREDRRLLQFRFERQLLLEACGVRVLEQLLRHPDGARRQRRPGRSDLGDALVEALGRDDFRYETPGERLLRAELAVRAHPLERAREPEQAVEEPGPPGVGHEPDADEPGDEC